MKHSTKKPTLASLALAAFMLMCTLFSVFPSRKQVDAYAPSDTEISVAYIAQDERTAVPEDLLSSAFSDFELFATDRGSALHVAARCLRGGYRIVILDFECKLYGYIVSLINKIVDGGEFEANSYFV